jgi:hypothetical protein
MLANEEQFKNQCHATFGDFAESSREVPQNNFYNLMEALLTVVNLGQHLFPI